jgi:hypothetical protein
VRAARERERERGYEQERERERGYEQERKRERFIPDCLSIGARLQGGFVFVIV